MTAGVGVCSTTPRTVSTPSLTALAQEAFGCPLLSAGCVSMRRRPAPVDRRVCRPGSPSRLTATLLDREQALSWPEPRARDTSGMRSRAAFRPPAGSRSGSVPRSGGRPDGSSRTRHMRSAEAQGRVISSEDVRGERARIASINALHRQSVQLRDGCVCERTASPLCPGTDHVEPGRPGRVRTPAAALGACRQPGPAGGTLWLHRGAGQVTCQASCGGVAAFGDGRTEKQGSA